MQCLVKADMMEFVIMQNAENTISINISFSFNLSYTIVRIRLDFKTHYCKNFISFVSYSLSFSRSFLRLFKLCLSKFFITHF